MEKEPVSPVVLFDGYCNLCSRSVAFILRRERSDVFRFASLQSEYAQGLLERMGIGDEAPDSVILVEGDRWYTRSTAALRITRKLRRLWPLVYGLVIIPRFIRDPLYDWIARNRFRWFGRRQTCFVPHRSVRHKFPDQ
jgi:predicted DCC family thiol-disulfide oxidoreductase YuxK